jgi:hypothetical protein
MSKHRAILLAIALLLAVSLSACGGGPAKPAVEILAPPSGTQVAVGEQVELEYRATDANAVIRVDLEVDGKVVDSQSAPVAEGQPSMTGVLRWTPTGDGTYALVVFAYNRDRVSSDPVGINIVAGEGGPAPETTATIGLIIPGVTRSPSGISTRTPGEPTPTQKAGVATATPTRPAGATATRPAATPTPTTPPPPPTATRRPPAPTATTPPPPPTATQGPVPARIELINNSGEQVYWVHFESPYHNFSDDQLEEAIVPAGGRFNWNVLAGRYRLQAVASDGYALSDKASEDVRGHYQWTIPQTRQPRASIVLTNNSGHTVYRVYFSPSDQQDWGPDRLGSEILDPGETYMWQDLAPGTYDMKAEKQDGTILDERRYQSIAAGGVYDWTLPPVPVGEATVTMHNDSGQIIWYVYIWPPGEPWGDDRLGSMTVLPTDDPVDFRIQPGTYNLRAEDENRQLIHGEVGVTIVAGQTYHWFVG